MASMITFTLILSVVGLAFLLYALLHSAHEADRRAGYMEEYGSDFDDDDEDY